MSKERSKLANFLFSLLLGAVFVVGLGLVIYGQRAISYERLGLMLLGLSMLLSLIYLYNRKFNV